MFEKLPRQVDKYLLTERLAVGGMAEVYKAKLGGIDGFEKTVAIKFILRELSEEEEFSQLFLEEARLCAHLRHPNIVEVYDFGSHGGRYYLAMECVDGLNLKRLLNLARAAKKEIPLILAAEIVRQAAKGLNYVHKVQIPNVPQLNLVHRDISPQNLLVDSGGHVKIVDFGIAKSAARFSRTQAGTVRGKTNYMAPEQAEGKTVDHRADQYSLGVVLYEMVTGVKLSTLNTVSGTNTRRSSQEWPSAASFRKDLHPALEHIISRMLQNDPAKRYTGCHEVVVDLSTYLDNMPEHELERDLGAMVREYATADFDNRRDDSRVFVPIKRPKRRVIGSTIAAVCLAAVLWLLSPFIFQNHPPTDERPSKPRAVVAAVAPPAPEATPEATPEPTLEPTPEPTALPAPRPKAAPVTKRPVATPTPVKQLRPQATPAPLIAAAPPPICPAGMIHIPAGNFGFGSSADDPDRNALAETARTTMSLKSYCVDIYEYPNRQGAVPRTQVSWQDAANFCDKAGKRLCTQHEWERVCKGAANLRYPYGNTFDAMICNAERSAENYEDDPMSALRGAGASYDCHSSEGIFDMSGNAEEWTASRGRVDATTMVARGGSSVLPGWAVRCESIRELNPAEKSPFLGFRCCKDAVTP